MAKKHRKKPKHTQLVLPGDKEDLKPTKEEKMATDRLGRSAVSGRATAFGAKPEPPAEPQDTLPANAILLPTKRARKKKRAPAVTGKRRRRRIGMLIVLALIVAAILLYASGLYLFAASSISDFYDGAKIRMQPGKGFPASFAINGFIKAEPLGTSSYALLGEKDMALLSSTGREIYRVQHGYVKPGLSAGDTRLVLYNRGGTEYRVESRSKTVVRRNTEQEILFAEMSPGGWLAMVTFSRYRATLHVYDPLYGTVPELSWPLVDDKPVLVAFQNDNKHLALGCLTIKDGALGTSIHLLSTDSDKIQATISEPDARLLQARYVGSNLLAVFDTFTAMYNAQGEETARYSYSGLVLQTADIGDNNIALVFGSSLQKEMRLVLLDKTLEKSFETSEPTTTSPRVLAAQKGVYLLIEQNVLAYNPEGVLVNTHRVAAKPQGLVWGAPPLVISAGRAESLEGLLGTAAVPSGGGGTLPVSAPQIAPASGSLPLGDTSPSLVTPPGESASASLVAASPSG